MSKDEKRQLAALRRRHPDLAFCGICFEPIVDINGQKFCLTCDEWMHDDCLYQHAKVRQNDGDWAHVGDVLDA